MNNRKIAVLGGGTGSFTVLSGLKYFPLEISAIVAMADDGGSTGTLKSEQGVLPPGDLRQALIALSELNDENPFIIKLMNHRFGGNEAGKLSGQSLGNLIISAAEQIAVSQGQGFEYALEQIHKFLRVKGRVMPCTTDKLTLMAKSKKGKVYEGEHVINTDHDLKTEGISEVYYRNNPTAYLPAVKAIHEAQQIVLCPGNTFCSIMPILIIPGIAKAILRSGAQVIMVSNLMTKYGHTDNFSIRDFVETYEKAVGRRFIDVVLRNDVDIPQELLDIYQQEGPPVKFLQDNWKDRNDVRIVSTDLVSGAPIPKVDEADKVNNVTRTLIRHNSEKLASAIYDLI